LQLADRMAQVADFPLVAPTAVTGERASLAAVALVNDVFGDTIDYHVLTNPNTEPVMADAVYSGDRATAVADLARSVTAEAYFDANGDFVIAPLPADTGQPPVWELDAGETGVLVDADEALDRTDTYNSVLVAGQANAESPPFFVRVVDGDPASPMRWGGPFGPVELHYESAAVTTVAQAQEAGEAMLDQHLGLSRSVTVDTVPNPALEPGDVVEVCFADGREERHIALALRVPLAVTEPVELVSRSLYRPVVFVEQLRSRGRRRPAVRAAAASAAAGWGSRA
jgi:hypothetical protein